MSVTISLTSEEQASLEAHAKSQGVSVDSLLREAVLQVISLSAHRKMDNNFRMIPGLPAKALTLGRDQVTFGSFCKIAMESTICKTRLSISSQGVSGRPKISISGRRSKVFFLSMSH